jgi:hypothetical protein
MDVMLAQASIHFQTVNLDSGLRQNDVLENRRSLTFSSPSFVPLRGQLIFSGYPLEPTT